MTSPARMGAVDTFGDQVGAPVADAEFDIDVGMSR
jgi:hypothetical protein